jgi:membrane protease YdiL (CAAX protease family)
MSFKASFKNASPLVQLLIMLILVFGAGLFISSLATAVLVMAKFGISQEVLQQLQNGINLSPELMRDVQFFSIIGMFIFPAIWCGWLMSDSYKDYLHTTMSVNLRVLALAILSISVAIPFLNAVTIWNEGMAFPEALKGVEQWMKDAETANNAVLEKMLYVTNGWDLAFNILIMAVLTGIGEEFIFRGVLQNIVSKISHNPHTIIWVVAFIFSAVHFQFYGFVTRLLLGAYLGYLLYYSKSIWVPAIVHGTYNLFGIVSYAIYQDSPEQSDALDTIGSGATWWLAVASLALFIWVFQRIRHIAPLRG